jgi:predicted nuclease with TOPRIM domain
VSTGVNCEKGYINSPTSDHSKKLEKLRIEADTNLSRAEKAEGQVKDLQDQVNKLETETHNLGNKVTLLQGDVDRAEKRVEEVPYRLFPLTVKTQSSPLLFHSNNGKNR